MTQSQQQLMAPRPATQSTATTLTMGADGPGDDDGDCGLRAHDPMLLANNATDSEAEKIYDDPYELMLADDWLQSDMERGAGDSGGGGDDEGSGGSGEQPPLMPRSRSWLCCPNSTSSPRTNGHSQSLRGGGGIDAVRGEYTSLVTQQPMPIGETVNRNLRATKPHLCCTSI